MLTVVSRNVEEGETVLPSQHLGRWRVGRTPTGSPDPVTVVAADAESGTVTVETPTGHVDVSDCHLSRCPDCDQLVAWGGVCWRCGYGDAPRTEDVAGRKVIYQ